MKHVKGERITRPERYACASEASKEFFEKAVGYVLNKIDENLDTFTYSFPSPSSDNHVYKPIDNNFWTPSFWTGMLWLAYEVTGNDKYRQIAEIQLESYQKRFDEKIHIDTHDLGFIYTLSCISAYKLTGHERAKDIALKAAGHLAARYLEKARIIPQNNMAAGKMIIDCMMNLPLLFWASQTTREQKYYDAACNHAEQSVNYLVREDASTFQAFFMNVVTGDPIEGKTHQGYSDDSCWSRGQAWGMYGFALSFIYTNNREFIELAKKLANYFLNRLPEDDICYWDLIFTDGEEERDSSAAAIAVCGLLETAKHLPLSDEYKRIYEHAALKILVSLTENYTTKNYTHSNGVLLHGVYSKPRNNGVDECCIWGDYFYLEALVRVLKDWQLYW